MKKAPTHLILAAAAAAAMLACCGCESSSTGPGGDPDSVTVVFRDGAEPLPTYLGTSDAVIKDGPGYLARSGNYGHRTVDTLGVIDIGGSLYEQRMLVRFDLSSITDCGSVTGAFLTIRVTPADTNRTVILDAWEATVPETYPRSWVEGTATSDGVSWLYLDGVSDWTAEGGDVLEMMDSREIRTDTTVTFELDPARVEGWIKTPWRNHGVLLRPRTSGQAAFLYAYMRESGDVALRPELLVYYLKGG
jgi:hypothetical protein